MTCLFDAWIASKDNNDLAAPLVEIQRGAPYLSMNSKNYNYSAGADTRTPAICDFRGDAKFASPKYQNVRHLAAPRLADLPVSRLPRSASAGGTSKRSGAAKSQPFEPHRYAAHLERSRDYCVESEQLCRWTGTHWETMGDHDARKDAYRWILEHEMPEHASDSCAKQAVKAALLHLPKLPAAPECTVIPVQNGYVIVDAAGATLRPADRSLGMRHVLNCRYDPSSTAVEFETFVARALPDREVRARVQEYIGYTFLPDVRFQRAQLWIGDGANGKGLLASIVRAMHHRWASVSLDELGGFERSAVLGASLIFADEVPRGRIDEQTLKKMISGDPLSINRKYESVVSVSLRAKWIACGNHPPAIRDHSTGFWRRWDIVPFGATIPERERDPGLGERIIRNELSGVLNWALEGLLRLLQRGRFDHVLPQAMRTAQREIMLETDSVVAWMHECDVTVDGDCRTLKEGVFAAYRAWCSENGIRYLSAAAFWKSLKAKQPKLAEQRPRQKGGNPRLVNVVLPRRQLTL